ncbi:hypothetical protein AgCh_010078 [Apium graveolens]
MKGINEKVKSLNYEDIKEEIKSVDSQHSLHLEVQNNVVVEEENEEEVLIISMSMEMKVVEVEEPVVELASNDRVVDLFAGDATNKHTPRDVRKEMESIRVLYGDEALLHLYENSLISTEQFPLQQGIVKLVVRLGGYFQNPLVVLLVLLHLCASLALLLLHFWVVLTLDYRLRGGIDASFVLLSSVQSTCTLCCITASRKGMNTYEKSFILILENK